MRGMGPNLASRPFANERPVKRTTLLVWLMAASLLFINVFIYQRHLSGQHEQRQAIRDLEDRIEAEQQSIEQLETKLASLDLDQQNEQVEYLNSQIAKRTFSWSRLFDRLEEVLPPDVQLNRVSPRAAEKRHQDTRLGTQSFEELVAIDLNGRAATGDQLLDLVDSLFEHESFLVPNLMSEQENEDLTLDFSLRVLYRPDALPGESPAVETSSPGEGG